MGDLNDKHLYNKLLLARYSDSNSGPNTSPAFKCYSNGIQIRTTFNHLNTGLQWGLEIRTPQTERRSKTEPFFDRFAKFGLFFEPNAKHEPTVRKPTKLGRFTNKK